MKPSQSLRASQQDGTYPRPQLLRSHWCDLQGEWSFKLDTEDVGECQRWWSSWPEGDEKIIVPFPPEGTASGIGDTSYHPVVWYRRSLSAEDLAEAGFEEEKRLILHFGAVDYRAQVWVDGVFVGEHEGGHTPFSFDVTHSLEDTADHAVTIRVEDDPLDTSQPRGKQDWLENPHVIWYHRTTGIWQPVWLEAVPLLHLTDLRWTSDYTARTVTLEGSLSRRPEEPIELDVKLKCDDQKLCDQRLTTSERNFTAVLSLPALANGQSQDDLLWSPERPTLIDASIEVGEDQISSYLGVRSACVSGGRFLLNGRPYYLRSVLNQGYWPGSNLAAPSPGSLRDEAQLIKDLGFNATRLHQKFEDPRFLYWADRLGILVWGEAPGCYSFDPVAIERTTREWLEVVRRDFSHPSIVVWVPLNESWGVQHIATDLRMQSYARALVDLTKALDGTRAVVSNDGWEQVDTDIVGIHDYEHRGEVLRERYASEEKIQEMIQTFGPAGRRLILTSRRDDAPVMLTEFGGISYDTDQADASWGYSTAGSEGDFLARLKDVMEAIHSSPVLAGFCYTQLADTLQETNGLVRADRTPKLPVETIRALIVGAPRA